jgi:hypothetical protein
LESSEAVASSSTRIGAFFRMARAIAIRCRWPPERRCPRSPIIVLERGRIVEIGRHDELVARPAGTYAMLYQMQLLETRKAERRMVPS